MPIVVVGNVFVDFKGFPEGTYLPAGRNAGRVEIVHGGVGRNVAEDIANVGMPTRFVSMVDNTAQGAEVLRNLQNRRVDTKYVSVVPDGMGIWLAVMDHTGDVVGSISKRPKMDAMRRLLEEQGDDIFADAVSVVVEIDIDDEVARAACRCAERHNVPVIALVANMSIALQRRDLIQNTRCFICNQQEAGIYFADDFSALSPEEMADELARRVQAAGLQAMVVTMGSQGAVWADISGRNEQLQAELAYSAGDVSVCTEAVKHNLISGYGARTIVLTAPIQASAVTAEVGNASTGWMTGCAAD